MGPVALLLLLLLLRLARPDRSIRRLHRRLPDLRGLRRHRTRSRHRHRRLLIRLRSVVKIRSIRACSVRLRGNGLAHRGAGQFSSTFPAASSRHLACKACKTTSIRSNRAARSRARREQGCQRSLQAQEPEPARHDHPISSNRCLALRPTRHARLWTGRRAAFRCLTETSSSNTRNRSQWHSLGIRLSATQGSFNNPIGLRNFQQNPFQNQYQGPQTMGRIILSNGLLGGMSNVNEGATVAENSV